VEHTIDQIGEYRIPRPIPERYCHDYLTIGANPSCATDADNAGW